MTVAYEGSDLETLAKMPNYYNWIIDIFRPYLKGHVMEIGAGIGTISEKILPTVDRLDLVEPSTNLTRLLPDAIKTSPKVSIFSDSIESHLPKIDDKSMDAIVMVNVLEHIEDDKSALRELNRTLKPAGSLLLFVPALKVLLSKLDQIHGHFRRYQKTPLEMLLLEVGFKIEVSQYFDIAGVLPWWIINKVLRQTTFNPKATEVYDSYIIPITRAFEERVLPPIGKNIILIASRGK